MTSTRRDRSLPSPATRVAAAGPLLTVGAILTLLLLERVGLRVPNPGMPLLLVVVYATLSYGVASGLASGLLCVAYALFLFSQPDQLFHYQGDDLRRLVVVLLVSPLIGIVLARLKRRLDQAMRREQAARARAEDAERRLRELIGGLDAIVWEADARTWRFTYVSPRAATLLGYPAERWLAEPNFWSVLIHPDDIDAVWAECLEATRRRRDHVLEYRVVAADGRVLWLRDFVSVVAGGAEGDRVRGVLIDITESRRVEDSMRFLLDASGVLASSLEHETTLRLLARLAVRYIADYCVVDLVEADGTLRRVAAAHRDADKEGLTRELLRFPYDPAKDLVAGVIGGGQRLLPVVSDAMLEAISRDDEHLSILRALGPKSAMAVPLMARGRVLGAATLVSTEPGRRYEPEDLALAQALASRAALAVDNGLLYRQAQEARAEAEEASRAKSAFLALISHEFRTPLTTIIGYADLLLDARPSPAPEVLRRSLERMRASAWHQLGLVEEILTFSRMEAGREELHPASVDLGDLAREAAALIEPTVAAKGLRFEVSVPASPARLWTDPGKIRQILLNLLSNAAKYTEAGGIRLDARLEAEQVVLRVADTGIGIAPPHRETIFEPFWQGDPSRRGGAAGSGLGLCVTRGLARLLGGDIEVESAPGVGSTFTVRLPAALPALAGQ